MFNNKDETHVQKDMPKGMEAETPAPQTCITNVANTRRGGCVYQTTQPTPEAIIRTTSFKKPATSVEQSSQRN